MKKTKLASPQSPRVGGSRRLNPVHPGSLPRAFSVTALDMDVTDNCNLGCVYCFKGAKSVNNMSFESMQQALNWLLLASGTAKSVNCNFMGGEPTMRFKQIRHFVPWAKERARAHQKDITFSMTTNLTLFTDEIRSFVDQYGFGILMSIDGSPEVQDASRPAKNGKPMSEIVEKWAKSLLLTRPRSTARATLHPNYVRTFSNSAEYLHSLGFTTMAVSASDYAEWTDVEFLELKKQLDLIVDFCIEAYVSGRRFSLSSFEYYINKLIRHRRGGNESSILEQHSPCGAGKGYMMVDHAGDIWPCHRFDGADEAAGAGGQFRLGNVGTGGFDHKLQRAFLDFDHAQRPYENCSTCLIELVCGGYCPAANLSDVGSIYTPHPAFCRWSKESYLAAEQFYDRLKSQDGDAFERMISDVLSTNASGEN